jgi:hypothetical protein
MTLGSFIKYVTMHAISDWFFERLTTSVAVNYVVLPCTGTRYVSEQTHISILATQVTSHPMST